jgi:hypothetical protein
VSESIPARELAAIFAALERELAAVPDSRKALSVLVQRAVELVPGAEMAGVTRGSKGGRFATIAATSEAVHRVDNIQYELGTGPCVDAIVESTVFNATDLRTDERWPVFGQRAFEAAGILSMLSFRLYLEEHLDIIAGLNFYSTSPAAFTDDSQAVALLLATHGALAMSAAAANEKAGHLMIALKNSREIGVAMGVLMAHYKITREEAFNLLRTTSQRTHRKLAEIANVVAETGLLPVE